MRVNYMGPACMGIEHPALHGYDLADFGQSSFLVEVSSGYSVACDLVSGSA